MFDTLSLFFIYHHSFKSKDGIYFNEFIEHFFSAYDFFLRWARFFLADKNSDYVTWNGHRRHLCRILKVQDRMLNLCIGRTVRYIKNKIQTNEKHWTQYITVISSIFLVGHCAFFNQRIAKSFPGIKANEKKNSDTAKGILKQRPRHFSTHEKSLTQSGNHWLILTLFSFQTRFFSLCSAFLFHQILRCFLFSNCFNFSS